MCGYNYRFLIIFTVEAINQFIQFYMVWVNGTQALFKEKENIWNVAFIFF